MSRLVGTMNTGEACFAYGTLLLLITTNFCVVCSKCLLEAHNMRGEGETFGAAARIALTEITVFMSINYNGTCLCIFFSPCNGSNSAHVVRSGFFKNVVRLHLCPSVLSCLSRAAGL